MVVLGCDVNVPFLDARQQQLVNDGLGAIDSWNQEIQSSH
jgi:hypothetical protein